MLILLFQAVTRLDRIVKNERKSVVFAEVGRSEPKGRDSLLSFYLGDYSPDKADAFDSSQFFNTTGPRMGRIFRERAWCF